MNSKCNLHDGRSSDCATLEHSEGFNLVISENNNIISPLQISLQKSSSITDFNQSQPVYSHNPTQASGQYSMPQCATSPPGFLRFPHPSKIDLETMQLSVAQSTRLQPRMNSTGRKSRHFVPNECKDEYYWQKRRKNNEAARKSREKRRTNDSVLEQQVALLSQENKLLRNELYLLKMKYGVIEGDNNNEALESNVEKKVKLDSPSDLPLSSLDVPSKLENGVSNGSVLSRVTSTSSAISATAIAIPQVKVILEKDSSSTDSIPANLVLSNLASGTLILSPINFACKEEIEHKFAHSSNHGTATSNLVNANPEKTQSDLKEFEAANTLATLCHCKCNETKPSSKIFETNKEETNGKPPAVTLLRHESNGEVNKCQNLPHKLRFKASKSE